MNLVQDKTWLKNHAAWRGKITANMKVTTMDDLAKLDRRYIRAIQVNAMYWCMGQSLPAIKSKIERLLK